MCMDTLVSEETKKTSTRFIERIRNGTYRKRILPNESEDYPDAKVLEGFKAFVASDEARDMIKDAYKE